MNIIKTKINDILGLLFFRPMSYLMLEGDKKNMFIKPLYFMACMLVLLFNMIFWLGLFVIFVFCFLMIVSAMLLPLSDHPNLQAGIFSMIIVYSVLFVYVILQ